MRLKRYAVTVLDNWTPCRTFWTWAGACEYAGKHPRGAYLYVWRNGGWEYPRY